MGESAQEELRLAQNWRYKHDIEQVALYIVMQFRIMAEEYATIMFEQSGVDSNCIAELNPDEKLGSMMAGSSCREEYGSFLTPSCVSCMNTVAQSTALRSQRVETMAFGKDSIRIFMLNGY